MAEVDFHSPGAAKKILGLTKLIANGGLAGNDLNAGHLAVDPDTHQLEHLASPFAERPFFLLPQRSIGKPRPRTRGTV
ncbi:hypothetical protein LJR098_000164 [Rhizobium sp. LjRoot98]|uniref:hypothetical protein n=1 Tax=unclassified Rhizobium TaxID=2613769 RepID=UPI0012E34AEA|nr:MULTISPECIES: hypothetical protein [unclassified Rhizobium]